MPHPIAPACTAPAPGGPSCPGPAPTRPPHTALLAACALLLAACTHTTQLARQDEVAASLAVPARWNAPPPDTPPGPSHHSPDREPAEPATGPDLAQWWQHFGDDTLTALVTQALAHNTTVQAAASAMRQARAQADVQAAAQWPTVNASAAAQRSRQGNREAGSRLSTGLDAAWEPDWWGRKSNALTASTASAAAAQANLHAAHVSISAEVASHYIELRSLQHRLHSARSNLAIQQQTQRIVQWRAQAGLGSALEVQQAQQSTAQTAAQLPALLTSAAQTRHALAVLTGQPPAALDAMLAAGHSDTPDGPAAIPQPGPTLALTLPAAVLAQRPDVRSRALQVQAALAQLSAQERASFPSLRISGSWNLGAAALGALTQGASVVASLAAGLALPVFDGGANRARVRAQEEAVHQARLAWKATVLTALQEVENALVQLHNDRQRLAHLHTAHDAAQRAAGLALMRYDSGLTGFQTVLDAQRTQLAAQDSLVSAQAGIATDHIRLYKALGGGWQAADAHEPQNPPGPPAPHAATAPPAAP